MWKIWFSGSYVDFGLLSLVLNGSFFAEKNKQKSFFSKHVARTRFLLYDKPTTTEPKHAFRGYLVNSFEICVSERERKIFDDQFPR